MNLLNILALMKALTESQNPPVEEELGEKKSEGKEVMPSRLSRFVVAWWGSIVLHLSLIVIGSASRFSESVFISDSLPPELLIIFVVYSLSFPITVVHRSFKMSLVRCFLVGVTLPALTYWMAAIILLIVSSL